MANRPAVLDNRGVGVLLSVLTAKLLEIGPLVATWLYALHLNLPF